MSILVKGVKMPRCCEVCPFNYDYYRCEALGDRFDDREEIDMETQRLSDCPLVEMPSRADVVEVKHGRWIKSKAGGVLCSECYSYAPDVEKGSFTTRRIEQEKSAYCPCCGAKMDGGNDE